MLARHPYLSFMKRISSPKTWSNRQRQVATGFLLAAPAIIGLAVFVFVPLIMGFWSSLHVGFGARSRFVWFNNYRYALTEPRFWNSLRVTSLYTLFYTFGSAFIGFIAALWIAKRIVLKNLFSSLIFLPYVITPPVATLVWQYMYDKNFGIFNYLLSLIGIPAVAWLSTPLFAFTALLVVQIWFSFGYHMILFAAGMQSIPPEYFEAAAIDGASEFQKVRLIILPLLIPTLVFVLIMSLLAGFAQSFVVAQVITGGGPLRTTEVFMLYVYDMAFGNFDVPLANALTNIMFILLAVASLLLYRWQERSYQGLYS